MILEFHPLFAADLEGVALFYNQREPGQGLGDRFLSEADEAVAGIERNPLMGGFIHRPGNIRHVLLPHFPYAIHYRVISGDLVFVVGIYHGSRDPKIWKERI